VVPILAKSEQEKSKPWELISAFTLRTEGISQCSFILRRRVFWRKFTLDPVNVSAGIAMWSIRASR